MVKYPQARKGYCRLGATKQFFNMTMVSFKNRNHRHIEAAMGATKQFFIGSEAVFFKIGSYCRLGVKV
jgi:hypothetical protein